MCDYKILAHTTDGYVILCNSCHHYQLAFGTTAVTLTPERFEEFCQQATHHNNENDLPGFEKQKRIALDLFTKDTMMVLNYDELKKLTGLLDESLLTEEIEHLFKDLNVNRE